MKVKSFLGKLLAVVFASALLFNCSGEVKNNDNELDTQTPRTANSTVHSVKKAEPFDIVFGELWPFDNNISYEISEDGKILTLNGESSGTLGVTCWERKVRLKGNRTLEIEILDKGNSSFSYSKMLKVFIWNVPNGHEIPMTCEDDMMQTNDPEFILDRTGKFKYSLGAVKDDAVYKLAFVFYNARLEGFKLKARFIE